MNKNIDPLEHSMEKVDAAFRDVGWLSSKWTIQSNSSWFLVVDLRWIVRAFLLLGTA